MIQVAAILPCRGRAEQTVRNVRRLLAAAGPVEWGLICVTGNEPELYKDLKTMGLDGPRVLVYEGQPTYWQGMIYGTKVTDAPLLCGLANDLLPGRDWLARGLSAYRATFGQGDGLLGFNDGIHQVDHSPHFLISRKLLDRYGGWPIWYRHNYGDLELCQRAHADGLYAKAPWAILYHDHHITGGQRDQVYAEGDASVAEDRARYEQRRRANWPHVSP